MWPHFAHDPIFFGCQNSKVLLLPGKHTTGPLNYFATKGSVCCLCMGLTLPWLSVSLLEPFIDLPSCHTGLIYHPLLLQTSGQCLCLSRVAVKVSRNQSPPGPLKKPLGVIGGTLRTSRGPGSYGRRTEVCPFQSAPNRLLNHQWNLNTVNREAELANVHFFSHMLIY